MEASRPYAPEGLAYWYFRFNGFLLLENFVIHPDTGADQRTDADLVGVRFRYRAELDPPMKDDARICDSKLLCNVIIAEIKRGECALNGPWTDPAKQNMPRVLRAIGCYPEEDIEPAAKALYTGGVCEYGIAACRLLAVGDRKGEISIPCVPQILFNDMIQFIHTRLREYLRQKSSVSDWPSDGQCLRSLANKYPKLAEFRDAVRRIFDLPCEK